MVVEQNDFGIIVNTINGNLVFAGCGGSEPTNPCDPDPEMLLTVTGASGTINWCGQTWNLPGDSGVEKSVCPTTYTKEPSGTYGFSHNSYFKKHSWAYANPAWDPSLSLNRRLNMRWNATGDGTPRWTQNNNVLKFDPKTGASYQRDHRKQTLWTSGTFFSPTKAPNTQTLYSDLSLILGVAFATLNNYTLTDEYFGSYNDGGIVYSWAKGLGW